MIGVWLVGSHWMRADNHDFLATRLYNVPLVDTKTMLCWSPIAGDDTICRAPWKKKMWKKREESLGRTLNNETAHTEFSLCKKESIFAIVNKLVYFLFSFFNITEYTFHSRSFQRILLTKSETKAMYKKSESDISVCYTINRADIRKDVSLFGQYNPLKLQNASQEL